MEALLVIIFIAISAWIFSFLRSGLKKQQPSNFINEQTSNSISNIDSIVLIDPSQNDNRVYEKDNFEQFNFYGATVHQAKGNYRITYTDQRGLTTERDISIKRAYDDNGKFAIDAHCHLRNAHRSFIEDRIKNAIDLDTGEVVNSVAQHAITQYENSPAGKMWGVIGQEINALYILIFVCRADGRMLRPERTIVADYLKTRYQDTAFDDTELDDAIKSIGTIDHRQFKRTIADMKSAGDIERLRDITNHAKRIVSTQEKIDPLEKASIEILEAALN